MRSTYPRRRPDGLRVLLEAKMRSDMSGIHMAGPIVEIINLQRI